MKFSLDAISFCHDTSSSSLSTTTFDHYDYEFDLEKANNAGIYAKDDIDSDFVYPAIQQYVSNQNQRVSSQHTYGQSAGNQTQPKRIRKSERIVRGPVEGNFKVGSVESGLYFCA